MVAATLALMLGFFGGLHPAFDSPAHFRVHLALATALAALVLLGSAHRLLALSALVFALSALSSTIPLMRLPLGAAATALPAAPAERAVYRLLELNLRYDNATPEKVLSSIGRVQPDVLALSEVSRMWVEKLDLLKHAYPHRIVCRHGDSKFGVAVLSRRPFAEGSEPVCHGQLSLAVAPVDFGGTTVEIASIHLEWPWPFRQPAQIIDLQSPLAALGEDAILAGDLNAAPWSAAAGDIANAGGLTILPASGPTWIHRSLPRMLLFAGLPIDNAFVKGGVTIHSVERLEAVGSDHVPLLIEFSVHREPGGPEDEPETATASRPQLRG